MGLRTWFWTNVVELSAVFGVLTGVLVLLDHQFAWVAALITLVCVLAPAVRYLRETIRARRARRHRGQRLDARL